MIEEFIANDPEFGKELLFGQRLVRSMSRKEAYEEEVGEAVEIAHDVRLPRRSVEFLLEEHEEFAGWRTASGLGLAFETFIKRLGEMDEIRRANASGDGLTDALRVAFENVRGAASALRDMGWPVNWEQCVRSILELSELGLANGRLVERYDGLPDTTTLGERLDVLGGLTFYIQTRGDGKSKGTQAILLTGETKQFFDGTRLHRNTGTDGLSKQFQYKSEWEKHPRSGKAVRIYI